MPGQKVQMQSSARDNSPQGHLLIYKGVRHLFTILICIMYVYTVSKLSSGTKLDSGELGYIWLHLVRYKFPSLLYRLYI